LHISFLERWEAIVKAWNIFCAHPWFGVGLGGIGPLVYIQENYSYDKNDLINPSIELFSLLDPKNVFFELLGSLGIFGLVAFLGFGWVIYSIFKEGFSLDLELSDRITLFALFVSLLTMLFCLQFNQGLFRSYVWLHMGLGVGYVFKLCPSGFKI
jgi:O-antigen ligase